MDQPKPPTPDHHPVVSAAALEIHPRVAVLGGPLSGIGLDVLKGVVKKLTEVAAASVGKTAEQFARDHADFVREFVSDKALELIADLARDLEEDPPGNPGSATPH
jgi:hypothetical protein